MPSIKQNPAPPPLPDFRNFGVILRALLGVNLLALCAALVQSQGILDWIPRYADMAAWVQPVLLLNLALLALGAPLLRRLPTLSGQALVVLAAAGSSAVMADVVRFLTFDDGGWQPVLRAALLGGLVAATLLAYLALRARAFSPALAEARLQALTARIRPHFLFNSLNAVLSLIRAEPRRAETALEELAELFRALMRDTRELTPLADEIALCRQYLDLEKLRLGERLHVEWDVDTAPGELRVPPLMLQPLLENAVYHGIEPLGAPGVVNVRCTRAADEVRIEVRNPCGGGSAGGSQMALANIRERLALHYDIEARMQAGERVLPDGRHEYCVQIVLPCRERGA
jgi:two-component system sensor histidine kinase AlgZ